MVYLFFRSKTAFLTSLAAGILIDVDHVLDYYLQQGIKLRIKEIYSWASATRCRFLYLFFHSLELIMLIWIIIWRFKLGIFWIAFAIGLTQHMLLDIIFNRNLSIYAYFLTFRIIKGFRKEDIIK